MRTIKDRLIDISVTIVIGTWMFLAVTLFNIGRETPPLKDAQIPQSTIDFFTGLSDYVDIGVIFNPFPELSDWGKYESIKEMKTIEDTCFIVFYSAKDSVKERPKADLALKYSNEAIPELERFMKNYPYPHQVRNHKLPIYLASSKDSYKSIIKQLGVPGGGGGSIGMYIYQISHMGTLSKGVVISPEAWDNKGGQLTENNDKGFKKTLWHELNHYVFFTNFDYFKNSEPYLWFTEGCAEYFAGADERNKQVNKSVAERFSFTSNSTGGEIYWVGYTAFVYYDKNFGRASLSDLVYYTYNNSLNTALSETSGISLKEWETGWKKYIQNFNSFLIQN